MIDRYNARKPFIGNLFLTSSHLVFKDPEYRKEVWVSLNVFYSLNFEIKLIRSY